MDKRILEIENLSVAYKDKTIIKILSISFFYGYSYAIIGSSGAGKSTLLRAIDGLLARNARKEGNIIFEGEELIDYSNIRGKRISFLLQDPKNQFNPTYTIGKQIERAITFVDKTLNKKERRELALKALESSGLNQSVYDQYPHQLSGGMLQRANLAIAFVEKASLVLLDEPTIGLDVELQDILIDSLIKDQRERKATLIYITHSLEVASKADYIIVMKDGKIVEKESSKNLLENPKEEFTKRLIKARCYD